MNDQLASSLSVLVSAIATALLMAASYYWGPQRRGERRDARRERSQLPREDMQTKRELSQWDEDEISEEEA